MVSTGVRRPAVSLVLLCACAAAPTADRALERSRELPDLSVSLANDQLVVHTGGHDVPFTRTRDAAVTDAAVTSIARDGAERGIWVEQQDPMYGEGEQNEASLLEPMPDGTLAVLWHEVTRSTAWGSAAAETSQIWLFDVDGDGRDEIVASGNYPLVKPGDTPVHVFRRDRAGRYALAPELVARVPPTAAELPPVPQDELARAVHGEGGTVVALPPRPVEWLTRLAYRGTQAAGLVFVTSATQVMSMWLVVSDGIPVSHVVEARLVTRLPAMRSCTPGALTIRRWSTTSTDRAFVVRHLEGEQVVAGAMRWDGVRLREALPPVSVGDCAHEHGLKWTPGHGAAAPALTISDQPSFDEYGRSLDPTPQ
jgi:hypothetical protein